jgi:DNA-binding transcriptional LysR family regulator
MNSDDLGLFAHVASSGSISRAAMDLGADQSTVSRRIGLVEAELGVRLFHRSGRGVSLAERGQQLLVYANAVTQTLNDAQQGMHDSAEQGPAHRVGVRRFDFNHQAFGAGQLRLHCAAVSGCDRGSGSRQTQKL